MRRLLETSFTPVLDTNIYAADDQMSTLQTVTFQNPVRGAELTQIEVLDKAKQSVALDLYFFKNSVTLAADNAASSISDTDMQECISVVNIATGDYDADAANSVATVQLNPGLALRGANPKSAVVYVALITRGGTPTYAAGSLVVSLQAMKDMK